MASLLVKRYTAAAILLMNTVLLLLVLNGLAWVVIAVRDASLPGRDEVSDLAGLRSAYPDWSDEERTEFLTEGGGNPAGQYSPYVQAGLRPENGYRTVVNEGGFRESLDQGPWPTDPDYWNVFMFGGSTTFGAKIPDSDTIASHLQKRLNQHTSEGTGRQQCVSARVYNFGTPAYFSTQERIQFEQLLLNDHVPDIAIFIDGLNDFELWNGLPDKTDQVRDLVENADRSRLSLLSDVVARTSLGRVVLSIRRRVGLEPSIVPDLDDVSTNEVVIDRWLGNKRMIEGIGRTFGTQPLFVWQPVPTYGYDLSFHGFSKDLASFGGHGRSHYGYSLFAGRMPDLQLGDEFLWLADMQVGSRENLYVDNVHYTSNFSDEISERIAEHLLKTTPRGNC